MKIRIQIDSMKEAEKFSAICKKFTEELTLRADHFCTDPKSVLGVLAMMYSARDGMYVDTAEMEDKRIAEFSKSIEEYLAD